MNNNNNTQNPINLFFTKHVLSIVSVFYITILSPTIDKAINDSLTKKDIANLINATLVSVFGASIKGFDSNVYTPRGLPGRNKSDVLDNLNSPIINTMQAVQSTQNAIQKPSISTISNALQDINDTVNNNNTSTIKPLQIPISSAKTRLELITRQDTFYKLEPVDSGLLDNSKKVKVDVDTSLFIDDYSINKNTNHLSFNIEDRIFYAFLDHIQLLDNGVQLLF